MKVIIIGGGIIGLSSAYYLKQSGWDVTVIDKSDFNDNCSYGNAGYICPSHFTPLATPGIVKKGLKWMWNSRSPFYVQPRLDAALISWGLKFMRSANAERVEAAAIPLRDIALLSQKEYEAWNRLAEFNYAYEKKGLIEIFQTKEMEEHAHHAKKKADELGLAGTRMLTAAELRQLEPQTEIKALGAIHFACDAHCYPNKLMADLIAYLKSAGVRLVPNETACRIENKNSAVTKVITEKNTYDADEVVLAAGSWSREVAQIMNLKIPLIPGRGYSVTLENSSMKLNYPAVLMEGRVAITPMNGNKMRFGGTMEITSHKTPPRMNRVQGILDAVKRYFPAFEIPLPAPEKIWYGYRPVSADGLPYIGRVQKWKNVTVATGHSMLGLSLGAGTGKLVDEIINGKKISMDISPFDPERFN